MAAIHEDDAFHEGERAIQERTGEPTLAVRHGAMIGASIMEPARDFLSTQRLLVVGSRGADGVPRVSIVFGEPGFVSAPGNDLVEIRVDRSFLDRTLRVPDYAGNGMFNSLGNLLVDDRVGLAFLDGSNQRLVRISGRADIQFDNEVLEPSTGGTRRFLDVSVDTWSDMPLDAAARWEDLERSGGMLDRRG